VDWTRKWKNLITRIEKGRAQVDSLLRQVEAARIAAEAKNEVLERAESDMDQFVDRYRRQEEPVGNAESRCLQLDRAVGG